MKVLLGVSNFGKISKAEIEIGDFVLFVGQNNSGKTYMMQLIYGVLGALRDAHFQTLENVVFKDDTLELGEAWVHLFETQANQYLKLNKEKIVFDIFHKHIKIEQLYIKFIDVDVEYRVVYKQRQQLLQLKGDEDGGSIEVRYLVTVAEKYRGNSEFQPVMEMVYAGNDLEQIISSVVQRLQGRILGVQHRDTMLFFPASRTGLLLLHKYFFSEKDSLVVRDFNREYVGAPSGNEFGLSTPVYDFLQFLLRHTTSAAIMEYNQELLKFIEKHLLDGQLIQQGDDTFYSPNNSQERIPLYLSSSLINELAPIVKALSGSRSYRFLFYDEIETCMHPSKQGEMAKLMIRLVNSGRKLIVSTHSDTMALRLNNLFLMSQEADENKLEKLGLTDADILHDKDVHVYQFKNMQDGTSLVEEIKFREVPRTGYDFELFSKNLDELYKECTIVME